MRKGSLNPLRFRAHDPDDDSSTPRSARRFLSVSSPASWFLGGEGAVSPAAVAAGLYVLGAALGQRWGGLGAESRIEAERCCFKPDTMSRGRGSFEPNGDFG